MCNITNNAGLLQSKSMIPVINEQIEGSYMIRQKDLEACCNVVCQCDR